MPEVGTDAAAEMSSEPTPPHQVAAEPAWLKEEGMMLPAAALPTVEGTEARLVQPPVAAVFVAHGQMAAPLLKAKARLIRVNVLAVFIQHWNVICIPQNFAVIVYRSALA